MRTWQVLAALLALTAAARAQQPGDTLQARLDTEISVEGRVVGVVPAGIIVTVEKVEKDLVWCWTPAGVGWLARKDLMTLEKAVDVWQEAIRQGDFDAWLQLGGAHDGQGDLDAALSDFNHYLRSHPGAPKGWATGE